MNSALGPRSACIPRLRAFPPISCQGIHARGGVQLGNACVNTLSKVKLQWNLTLKLKNWFKSPGEKYADQLLKVKLFHIQGTKPTTKANGIVLLGRATARRDTEHPRFLAEDLVLFSRHLSCHPKVTSPLKHKTYHCPEGKHGCSSMLSSSSNPKKVFKVHILGSQLSGVLC